MTQLLPTPDRSGVMFLPIGGCGQFGANFTLYGFDASWIAVDCGMGFAGDTLPGVDLLVPDPSLIAAQKDKLKALFITHAHEDHIGGVAWVWPHLKCPIYASPFAAAVLRKKLEEHTFRDGRPKIIEVSEKGETITIGAWSVTYVPVAHSIPEGNALIIKTEIGQIVHTGDWTLDAHPVISKPTNPEPFRVAGAAGVMAYVGDSTNAEVAGRSQSEEDVEQGLKDVFSSAPRRVAVTMFSSNIGRVLSVYRAARACGRKVATVGRSLQSMIESARKTGYVADDIQFIDDEAAMRMPEHKVVFLVTGSQGEERAALSRIARNTHPSVRLQAGDVCVFSSRAIPGNETAINEIKNNLLETGVRIVTDRDACVHVSGHPARDELTQMLGWIKPNAAIPVHGERVQMEAHGELARTLGVPHVHVPRNGDLVRITPDGVKLERHMAVSLNAVDFARVVPADHIPILERRKMSFSGAVQVTLVADRQDSNLLDVQVTAFGILDLENKHDIQRLHDLEDAIAERYEGMPKSERMMENKVTEVVRTHARRFFRELYDIKPLVSVHVSLV